MDVWLCEFSPLKRIQTKLSITHLFVGSKVSL